MACYIDKCFPVLLFLVYKYADSVAVEKAILANANAGGENVARGSLLGALLGAGLCSSWYVSVPRPRPRMDKWSTRERLRNNEKEKIMTEVDQFLNTK